jgi:hypothetical protein
MDDVPDLGYGDFFENGKQYLFAKKWEVTFYFWLWEANWPVQPTNMRVLGRESSVSASYARRVVQELTTTGCLQNLCVTKLEKNVTHGVGLDFTVKEEVFLLALRIDCPFRPKSDYVGKLREYYGREVSASNISNWFQKQYDYAGSYKVPNLVPIDNWMMRNATRVMTFRAIMDMFPDHSRWNFLDEKHIVNRDTLPKLVRADPLTGYVNVIPVSGNFRNAHNIFAVLSPSPTKRRSMA